LGADRYTAFVEGMRGLGYIERKTVIIEARFADGNPSDCPNLWRNCCA
jgi:hypothetical protein